mmetsp:Transcript_77234/g.201034  ORF Transcript_77234/g.201034 Transcript_77234/m.201034 type:complete len:235 (-) Transcript_77234:328-1032(-)
MREPISADADGRVRGEHRRCALQHHGRSPRGNAADLDSAIRYGERQRQHLEGLRPPGLREWLLQHRPTPREHPRRYEDRRPWPHRLRRRFAGPPRAPRPLRAAPGGARGRRRRGRPRGGAGLRAAGGEDEVDEQRALGGLGQVRARQGRPRGRGAHAAAHRGGGWRGDLRGLRLQVPDHAAGHRDAEGVEHVPRHHEGPLSSIDVVGSRARDLGAARRDVPAGRAHPVGPSTTK